MVPFFDAHRVQGIRAEIADTVVLAAFPNGVFLTAAAFIHGGDSDDYILLCGGNQCAANEPSCDISDLCYTWTPATNAWEPVASLIEPRRSHILAFGPNLDTGKDLDCR